MGHASTHAPQRMHASTLRLLGRLSMVRPDVPFMTGASSRTAERPIIGPPAMARASAGSVKGNSANGVPKATT